MSEEKETNTLKSKYRVVSVDETETPEGMPEGNWFRYVIEHRRSQIVGLQPGTRQTVTEHAETFAEDLNERSASGTSAYAARKRK